MHDRAVIRLSDAMVELARTLHGLAHSGDIQDCADSNCRKFRPIITEEKDT